MPFSRRLFLEGLSAVGVASLVPSALAEVGVRAESSRAFASDEPAGFHALTPVPIERVVVEDAFWTPKRDVWTAVMIPDLLRKFEEHQGGVFANFDRVRDGRTGGHAGLPWFDGLVYETIRGAADFLRSRRDPELEVRLDGIIDRIAAAAAKDPGGYLNTYTQLQEPEHRYGLNGGLEVWQHEFYNLGALVEAGVHYYRATGRTPLLEAGIRVANTISELVGPAPKLNLVPSHELPEEAMVELYELLAEQPTLKDRLSIPAESGRYLALAEFWIENRGRGIDHPKWESDRGEAEKAIRTFDYSKGRPSWGSYAQDHVPVFEQKEIVGHAVRATLLASAVAATARVNRRDEYAQTARRLWENMTFRRMHITGGVGAYAAEEKFGPDYALPNDAYLETCAAVGAGFFHANMNRAFGHARYADELERVVYNGVLCGTSIAGDRYTYVNPLVADERHERWSWHDCPCCPPMFAKMMGALPGYVYATDVDSAYVNLFIGGHGAMTVGGTELTLRQRTEYPWNGAVRIDVEPASPAEFGLMVRIPAWCEGATVRVNGKRIPTETRVRGYVRIARRWKRGDFVELDLPMPAQAVRAHPKVVENLGRTAIVRGPLVYCLESADNGGEIETLTLAARPEFKTERWPNRLGGVVAISASAVESEPAWGDALYSPAPAGGRTRRRITAIPYYAYGNRGPVRLAVWIPREG